MGTSRKLPDISSILQRAPLAKFPEHLSPTLATLVDAPFDAQGWIFEVKWDGYRALAFCQAGKIELRSRNDESFSDRFYPVVAALKRLDTDAVIDGEIVVVDASGISRFSALQNWRSEADGKLLFFVFDILWYRGRNLKGLPLKDRYLILKSIVPRVGIIRLSEQLVGSGTEVFAAIKKKGLEGIVAKKLNSVYQTGKRTTDWLKIKVTKQQEMVIGGYTLKHGSGRPFSALLAGVFEDNKFVYMGKVGTGFSIQMQIDLLKKFKPFLTKTSPFVKSENATKASHLIKDHLHANVFYLKPALVCEVNFTELTRDGLMRHPSFLGLRMDKKASEVIMEKPYSTHSVLKN